MAGYDPKKKRTHSPTAAEGPAPVDDLLGAPPAPEVAPDAPPAPAPVVESAPALEPGSRGPAAAAPAPAAKGPDPRLLAIAVAAVLAVLLFWRRRRG